MLRAYKDFFWHRPECIFSPKSSNHGLVVLLLFLLFLLFLLSPPAQAMEAAEAGKGKLRHCLPVSRTWQVSMPPAETHGQRNKWEEQKLERTLPVFEISRYWWPLVGPDTESWKGINAWRHLNPLWWERKPGHKLRNCDWCAVNVQFYHNKQCSIERETCQTRGLAWLPCFSVLHCFVSAGWLNAAVSCRGEIMSRTRSGLGSLRRVLMSFQWEDADYHTALGPQLTRVAICLG